MGVVKISVMDCRKCAKPSSGFPLFLSIPFIIYPYDGFFVVALAGVGPELYWKSCVCVDSFTPLPSTSSVAVIFPAVVMLPPAARISHSGKTWHKRRYLSQETFSQRQGQAGVQSESFWVGFFIFFNTSLNISSIFSRLSRYSA